MHSQQNTKGRVVVVANAQGVQNIFSWSKHNGSWKLPSIFTGKSADSRCFKNNGRWAYIDNIKECSLISCLLVFKQTCQPYSVSGDITLLLLLYTISMEYNGYYKVGSTVTSNNYRMICMRWYTPGSERLNSNFYHLLVYHSFQVENYIKLNRKFNAFAYIRNRCH